MTDGNAFPDELNNLERNRGIQKDLASRQVNGLDLFGNIYFAPSYAKAFEERVRKTNQEWLGLYVHLGMFLSMAVLGFYSFDCVGVGEDGRSKYELVARPARRDMSVNEELPVFEDIEPIMEGEELVGFWM